MNNKYTKKGQVLTVAIVIAVISALLSAYVILSAIGSSNSKNEFLGMYQSAISETLSDSNKVLAYIDESAKLSVDKAILEFSRNGGSSYVRNSENENSQIKYCGSYGYNLWNTVDKNCYPNYDELGVQIDTEMSKYTYLAKFDSKDVNQKYFSSILSKNVNYEYVYYPSSTGTKIVGVASNPYTLYIYRDKKILENEEINNYVSQKYESLLEGDIPGVKLNLASPSNYKTHNSRNIKYIVIHYTAGNSIDSAVQTFQDPLRKASAHYIIGSTKDNFDIVQSVREKDVAYHAGCDSAKYGCTKEDYKSMNTESIGFEIVNIGYTQKIPSDCLANGDSIIASYKGSSALCWQKYPEKQYEKVVALTAFVAKKYNIPIDREHILGHDEIVLKNKLDPGPAFDFDKFIIDVTEISKLDEQTILSKISTKKSSSCPNIDSDWKITNAYVSSKELTSNQKLNAIITIENSGKTCNSIKPMMKITASVKNSDILNKNTGTFQSVEAEKNVYPISDNVKYTNIELQECTFTSDKSLSEKEKLAGKCVLWVPNDGILYEIEFVATDGKTTNTYSQKLEFKVMPSQENIYSFGSPAKTPTVVLTKQQEARIQKTKQNLESLGILGYVEEISQKEGVPKEIVLGLITQESGGINHKPNAAGASGIMQVTKRTFDDTKFDDKCNWNDFSTDLKCQVRAGIAILKKYYDATNGKTVYYVCSDYCDPNNHCQKGVDVTYSGWSSALRRYNGGGDFSRPPVGKITSGCTGYPDFTYVEKVMLYSSGFGYVDSYSGIVKDEIQKGILGTYDITPTFNVNTDFDLELFNKLSEFVSTTVKTCNKDSNDKVSCIDSNVKAFNTKIAGIYGSNYRLTTNLSECDDKDSQIIYSFVEEVEKCATSVDMECNCILSNKDAPDNTYVSINNFEDYASVEYTSTSSKKLQNTVYLNEPIYTIADNVIQKIDYKNIQLNNITLYNDGKQLILKTDSTKPSCTKSDDKFRMCFKTNYRFTTYEGGRISYELVKIPFAITLRDSIPPVEVKNLELHNVAHQNNQILATWNKNSEKDVVKYVLYLADSSSELQGPTPIIKTKIPYRVLSAIPENYHEYKNIDYKNPECEVTQNSVLTNSAAYCIFKYDAVDKYDVATKIELKTNKLYFISQENKFLYIIDGKDTYNKIVSEKEKFIAINAIDVDENEVDTVKFDSSLPKEGNVQKITPKDLREPGFAKIINTKFENENKILLLDFENISTYINGESLNTTVKYNLYMSKDITCQDHQMLDLKNIKYVETYSKNTNNILNLEALNLSSATYCYGITAKTQNNLEFDVLYVKNLNLP